jgi:hypothetical protein
LLPHCIIHGLHPARIIAPLQACTCAQTHSSALPSHSSSSTTTRRRNSRALPPRLAAAHALLRFRLCSHAQIHGGPAPIHLPGYSIYLVEEQSTLHHHQKGAVALHDQARAGCVVTLERFLGTMQLPTTILLEMRSLNDVVFPPTATCFTTAVRRSPPSNGENALSRSDL